MTKFNKIGLEQLKDLGFYGSNKKLLVRCTCGKELAMWASHFYRGSNSCECTKNRKKERLYSIWMNMKSRCNNTNSPSHAFYGNKGISVCVQWENNYYAFREWSLNNGYKDELSIDRIDFNGNYKPSNCRWVNTIIQNTNKSNNVNFTLGVEVKCFKHWCKTLGLNYKSEHTFLSRNGKEKSLERLKKAIWYIEREIKNETL